jgi:hypothetical protein
MAFESDPIAQKLNDFVVSEEAWWWLVDFNELTSVEQALIGVWELEQEVYNGGFVQYFYNSGERVPAMREILQTIGANHVASIVERAIAAAAPAISLGDEAGWYDKLNALSEGNKDKLDNLERELSNRLDDLNLLLFRYLSKHRDQLNAPEEFWTEAGNQ